MKELERLKNDFDEDFIKKVELYLCNVNLDSKQRTQLVDIIMDGNAQTLTKKAK